MRSTIRHLSTLSALLVAGFVAHASASAQETRLLAAPTGTSAVQLEQLAYQPIENGNWLPSAKALEQAAGLRAPNDLVGVKDLLGAATLYASMHRPEAALPLLAEAGKRAERIGANELALQAYVGGLSLAEQQEDIDQVQFYLARVDAVAALPGVPAQEKQAVQAATEEAANEW